MPTFSFCHVPPLSRCCRSIAALFTLTILAGSIQCVLGVPTLTLTDVSSTALHYSWDDGSGSGTLTSATGHSWSGAISGPAISTPASLSGAWQDPDSSLFNNASVNVAVGSWQVAAASDALTALLGQHANGDSVTAFAGGVAVYKVRFISQAAAVPEGGATLIVLLLAIGSLAIIRRRITPI